jgi:two-component system, NtrC family, sensor kinase
LLLKRFEPGALSMTESAAWKIVLIDDEEDIREIMTISLQDRGYWVETAAEGAAGIRLCQEALPQIVITDIRMPGIDGLQVLKTIKQQLPDIEVIVATAFGEMDLAIRALQLDASDFITKPVSDNALHLALSRARERYTSRKQIKDYTVLLEKEKAETSQQLFKTIAFQKNLIENSMDGILGCDEMDLVVTYNQSMEQILGYPKIEVIHNMTFDHFFPAEHAARFKEKLAAEKFGGQDRLNLYEATLRNQSGREVPVQVSAVTLFDEGRANGLVCFFRDLREIRKLEREMADQARILHQDKMMSLGKLAASVVHEINNPLSGILNYLRLMNRIIGKGPLTENHREKFQRFLDLVQNETKRCSQIVSNLLSFSRKSPPTFSQVQIDELLKRCILLSHHKLELSNIQLESSIPENLPPVEGDYNQLQQCIINLIFNAIDAMPDGGTLNLRSRFDTNQGTMIVMVGDSGHGISAQDLPHIFEPFFTTKNEGYGVGLGLSTVYGIIERHKGNITVKSQPGEGTAFRLELPSSTT